MQDEFVSNRLTRAEVKDCAYARLCRRGTAIVFGLFAIFLLEVTIIYLIVHYNNPEREFAVYFLPLGFAPVLIISVAHNCVNLHRLYANYENWEPVTCKITYQSAVNSASKLFGSKTSGLTTSFTFTTADGNIHNIGPRKVKNFALIAVLRLDRYNGEAQCLYDAKNHVLYPFSQLPPKSKKA